jgi:hypothetical protein
MDYTPQEKAGLNYAYKIWKTCEIYKWKRNKIDDIDEE